MSTHTYALNGSLLMMWSWNPISTMPLYFMSTHITTQEMAYRHPILGQYPDSISVQKLGQTYKYIYNTTDRTPHLQGLHIHTTHTCNTPTHTHATHTHNFYFYHTMQCHLWNRSTLSTHQISNYKDRRIIYLPTWKYYNQHPCRGTLHFFSNKDPFYGINFWKKGYT